MILLFEICCKITAFVGYRITYICRITTIFAENAEKDDFFDCHFC